MKRRKITKFSQIEKREIKDAERSFRKIWDEIKPFIKKREFKQYSTTAEWRASSQEL